VKGTRKWKKDSGIRLRRAGMTTVRVIRRVGKMKIMKVSPARFHSLESQRGMALVITLMVLVIITAMVVEFSYGVYTGTTSLYNWRDSQRLSIMAKSGVNVAAKYLSTMVASQDYSYPGSMELPVENPFEDFKGVLTVRIEDENSKFNVNALIGPNGRTLNVTAFIQEASQYSIVR
jgi:type II secretory pathway component PulK